YPLSLHDALPIFGNAVEISGVDVWQQLGNIVGAEVETEARQRIELLLRQRDSDILADEACDLARFRGQALFRLGLGDFLASLAARSVADAILAHIPFRGGCVPLLRLDEIEAGRADCARGLPAFFCGLGLRLCQLARIFQRGFRIDIRRHLVIEMLPGAGAHFRDLSRWQYPFIGVDRLFGARQCVTDIARRRPAIGDLDNRIVKLFADEADALIVLVCRRLRQMLVLPPDGQRLHLVHRFFWRTITAFRAEFLKDGRRVGFKATPNDVRHAFGAGSGLGLRIVRYLAISEIEFEICAIKEGGVLDALAAFGKALRGDAEGLQTPPELVDRLGDRCAERCWRRANSLPARRCREWNA